MFGFGNSTPDPTPAAVSPDATPAEGALPSPDGGVAPVAPSTPEPVGLDKFTKLLDNTGNPDIKTEDKGEESNTPFDPVALLNDPAAIDKITEGLDFSSSISAETQQKLADGTPDAIISLVQDVSKASYIASLKHASILSQQAMTDGFARQEQNTGNRISESLGKHELQRELPELKNPIVAMAVDGFQAQLQSQNPTMDEKQIAAHTREYVKELSFAMNPESNPRTNTPKDEDGVDWLKELGF